MNCYLNMTRAQSHMHQDLCISCLVILLTGSQTAILLLYPSLAEAVHTWIHIIKCLRYSYADTTSEQEQGTENHNYKTLIIEADVIVFKERRQHAQHWHKAKSTRTLPVINNSYSNSMDSASSCKREEDSKQTPYSSKEWNQENQNDTLITAQLAKNYWEGITWKYFDRTCEQNT